MIAALLIFTLGIVIVIGVVHFWRHNKHPMSRAATKEVFSDGGSAHTGLRESGDKPEHIR